MSNRVKVRMDRGRDYSTVHGERASDDPFANTHFVQDGLPFDAEGFLLLEHPDYEADKGDRCSDKAAELRAKAHKKIRIAEKKEAKRKAEEAEQARRNPRRSRSAPVAPAPTARRAPPPPAPSETYIGAPPALPVPAAPGSEPLSGDVLPPPGDDPDLDADDIESEDEDDDADYLGDDGDEDDDDADDEDGDKQPNIEAYLRGDADSDIQWHILTNLIAARWGRRVKDLPTALEFMIIEEDGPKIVPIAQLSPRLRSKLPR